MSEGVGYTLGFCVAVCLVCAVFVSTSAVGLKDRQEVNRILDRQKKVLIVAGLMEDGADATREQVEDLFHKRIKAVVIDLQADAVATGVDISSFDQAKVQSDPATSSVAPKNLAGVSRVPNQALAYYVSKTEMREGGEGFVLDQYILPVEGKGLWSTLYGFVALAPDANEIRGLTFYQHGETPGLGGEVDNPSWKAKWPGRNVYGPDGSGPSQWGEPKIAVKKGMAGSPTEDPYQVDGLSGATITSKGVSNLLRFWLGEQGFGPFLKTVAKGA